MAESGPIVCGTDFSNNALEAALVAAALARRLEAPLVLAHSVDETGQFPAKVRAVLLKAAHPRLETEAARLGQATGLPVTPKVLVGCHMPGAGEGECVADFAGNARTRLVVVGASRAGALGRWLMGSVSERIAQGSPAPTLVVRAAAPFKAWMEGSRPLRVFVAVSFDAIGRAALQWAANLCRVAPCEVILGHLDRPAGERAELAIFDALCLTSLNPETARLLEQDLKALGRRFLGFEPEVRTGCASAALESDLLDMVGQSGADLLVLGTHQRQGFSRLGRRSLSRRILHHAQLSVVCVPLPAPAADEAAQIPARTRVLVASDFSEPSGFALPHAYAGLPERSTICLLHVISPGDSINEDALRERLLQGVPAEVKNDGVTTEVRVVQSADPAAAICEVARQFGADLICLGTHGRTGLAAVALGSVAQSVVAAAHVPVLLVRSGK